MMSLNIIPLDEKERVDPKEQKKEKIKEPSVDIRKKINQFQRDIGKREFSLVYDSLVRGIIGDCRQKTTKIFW